MWFNYREFLGCIIYAYVEARLDISYDVAYLSKFYDDIDVCHC